LTSIDLTSPHSTKPVITETKVIMGDRPDTSAGAVQQQQQQQRKRRGILPPEIIDLMVAPVKVGTWTG
jgi:hypothetical protein